VSQIGVLSSLLARDVLAVAFFLTATWKVSHPREYIASYARMRPAFVRGIDSPARAAVVVTEFLCSCLLIISPAIHGAGQEAGPLLAVALLILFTAALQAQPSLSDCGCWSSPVIERVRGDIKQSLLVRNGLLLAISAVAVIPVRANVSSVVFLSSLACAVVVAPVLLELPQVLSVVRHHDQATR